MGWIQKLHQTYEQCASVVDASEAKPWPLSHLVKKAHVEVVVDSKGNFRRARALNRIEAPTLIPVTEFSAGRTANVAPHPLCEEIGYCAADFPMVNVKKQEAFEAQLLQWCRSTDVHPKAAAIFAYLKKKNLWTDLNAQKLFPVAVVDASGKKTKIADKKVFVRWRVEAEDDPRSGTWEDDELVEAWKSFDRTHNSKHGFCMVLGQMSRICQSYPRFIRRSDDGAKLISANDSSGFTFRGRFTDAKDDYAKQACTVSFEVAQKAHNALRWLIHRQGYRNEDQMIVAWAVAGKPIPDLFKDSLSLFLGSDEGSELQAESRQPSIGDAGQAFALRLKKTIAGYRAKLDSTEDIVVLGLDSATPGRMAIIFYRELKGSEFLGRVHDWHERQAWIQNFGKESKFVGAPAPKDIAEAAFGRRLDDKLRKATVERLLPCIIDGQPLPRDLVESVVRRTCNRAAFEKDKKGRQWEWEKSLGIACALFKGFHKERGYQMALEQDRKSRDYLYGCLLAIAEHIEGRALYISGETRDTTAAKLTQRFADRPASTWRIIEPALKPYMSRLRAKRPPFLRDMEKLLDKVVTSFQGDDFLNDSKLSGEFLLGYHCQRQELNPPKTDNSTSDEDASID